MEVPAEISKTLVARAWTLESIGLDEVAWSKADALQVLIELEGSAVALLGGDVYLRAATKILPAYDNWSCERRPNEDMLTFARRSQTDALGYVRDYPESPDEELLFVFVFARGALAGI